MKPKYYILIIIILIGAAFSVYLYTRTFLGLQPKPALPKGYIWYYNQEQGFKIAYPETWKKKVVSEEFEAGDQVFYATFGENPYDSYAPAIVIIIRSGKCEAEQVKDLFPKTTEVIINGKKGLEVTIENDMGQRLRTIMLGVSEKCYTIVCSSELGIFDKYAEIFDNSINSLTVE